MTKYQIDVGNNLYCKDEADAIKLTKAIDQYAIATTTVTNAPEYIVTPMKTETIQETSEIRYIPDTENRKNQNDWKAEMY